MENLAGQKSLCGKYQATYAIRRHFADNNKHILYFFVCFFCHVSVFVYLSVFVFLFICDFPCFCKMCSSAFHGFEHRAEPDGKL